MTDRTISRPYRSASASSLINAVAESLTEIKAEDSLTDADIGAFLGKGVDQGAKYRAGLAEMGLTAFLRGCERWNGRFANRALALVGMKIVPLEAGKIEDRAAISTIARLLMELSIALEDGQIDPGELRALRPAVEDAGQYIDRIRQRLAVRAAS